MTNHISVLQKMGLVAEIGPSNCENLIVMRPCSPPSGFSELNNVISCREFTNFDQFWPVFFVGLTLYAGIYLLHKIIPSDRIRTIAFGNSRAGL